MKTDKKMKSALSLLLCLVCVAIVSVAAYAYTTSTGVYISNTAVITSENGAEINIVSADVRTEIVYEAEDKHSGGSGGGSTHRSETTTENSTAETVTEAVTDTDKDKETNTEKASEVSSETSAAEPSAGFDDTENHWAKDYIEALHDENIVNGITDTLYYPDLSTKRGDFAVVLNRMLKLDEGNIIFTDVPSQSYYAQAIANCASAGIYIGYGDGTFKPENIITREEMMVIIAKLMNNSSSLDYKDTYSALESFSDSASVSWWSAPYVNYLAEERIIVGDNNRIRPKDNVTRAEMAVIIYNYLNR